MTRLVILSFLALAWAPAHAAPAPDGRGDACAKNEDCGWDDACMPSRCGARREHKLPCEESAPPPGECLCNEGMCTLRPKDAARSASAESCKQDDECALDVGKATCRGGGATLVGPIEREGPVCLCDRSSARCALTWSGPVACKRDRDCSLVRTPRLRPVPAREVPRPHGTKKVRPCKDDEVDSVCGEGGVCRIVAWKC